MQKLRGRLVDIFQEKIYSAEIVIGDGKILSVTTLPDEEGPFILPGFIDAHVHIESSLLIPSEFARLAVVHGTVATVSDPHEIANVVGLPGVEFMIRNGRTVPFHFYFGAPGCVPATRYETAGATLDTPEVTALLKMPEIKYLAEMMNFPGVLNKDPEVLAKIAAARALDKPVDGHAPGLRGEAAREYIAAGISTDHECFTAEEALDKLKYGMKILIREGSAARNFEALIGLLNDYPDQMMFCSDDKHPDSLVAGHIDQLCARAVAKGIDLFKILKAACLNPVIHYRLDTGLLRAGDPADLIVVEDLKDFKVKKTFIGGVLVAEDGVSLIARNEPAGIVNKFSCEPKTPEDFSYLLNKWGEEENVEQVYVIEALDGRLITNKQAVPVKDTRPENGRLQSNPEKDILKIVVVNRYQPAPVAKSFIRNFGLKRGALASSVAHDSHNIVAVGVDDESLAKAVNGIIREKGGISCVDPGTGQGRLASSGDGNLRDGSVELVLPLPVGGLMSAEDGYSVAEAYTAIDAMAKSLGSPLSAPFMTLSFMALLVIPHLKLSDLGLFDGDAFALL